MEVRRLHPLFAAELIGADLAEPPSAALVTRVEDAMRDFAVLVVRGQGHIGDEEHLRFSRAFGPLELPPGRGVQNTTRPRFRPELYDASNLDHRGEIIGEDSLFRQLSKGNELFHTDSSFNALPTKWSLLMGHAVPPDGGATEFVDCRAAYEALPQSLKERIEGREAEHNIWVSRERAGFKGEYPFDKTKFPPVPQPLVRVSASGRKCLYVGAHADHIIGMSLEEGRALLLELLAHAKQERFIYSHPWRQGDLVIWDNRCTLHRATPFAYEMHKRDLRRSTINESGPERSALSLKPDYLEA